MINERDKGAPADGAAGPDRRGHVLNYDCWPVKIQKLTLSESLLPSWCFFFFFLPFRTFAILAEHDVLLLLGEITTRAPPGPLMHGDLHVLSSGVALLSLSLPTKETVSHWRKKKVEPTFQEQWVIGTIKANWMQNPLQVGYSHNNKNTEQGRRESHHRLRTAADGSLWPSVQIKTLFMDRFYDAVHSLLVQLMFLANVENVLRRKLTFL